MGTKHTCSLLLLHPLLLLFAGVTVASSTNNNGQGIVLAQQVKRWKVEISKSLANNIHGKCSLGEFELSDSYSRELSDFLYQPIFPSDTDTDASIFTRLVPSLSEVNSRTLYNENSEIAKWANDTSNLWMFPDDHPMQNRSSCLDAMKGAIDRTHPLVYESYKKVDRAFYVLRAKHGIIHPSGAVMLRCGYYQGAEGCETRWSNDYSKWNSECSAYLHKHHRSSSNNPSAWWSSALMMTAMATNTATETRKPNLQYTSTSNSSSSSSTSKSKDVSYMKGLNPCWGVPADATPERAAKLGKATHHKRVFVIAAAHDFNFHHLIVDSLARLSHHMDFLRKNPDIKIHIRRWETIADIHSTTIEDMKITRQSRDMLMALLGIDLSRVVSGAVLADEVFIPRCLRCSYALSNPLEIRRITKYLVAGAKAALRNHSHYSDSGNTKGVRGISKMDDTWLHAKIPARGSGGVAVPVGDGMELVRRQLDSTASSAVGSGYSGGHGHGSKSKRNVVILQRNRDVRSWGFRQWNDLTTQSLVEGFQRFFPHHQVLVHSSNAMLHADFSMAREIHEMTYADVLVGVHGAGLTKEIFMPHGSLVMEVVGRFNDVSFPLCGYYGPLGAIFGHHHYVYSYNNKNYDMEALLNATELAADAAKFYRAILLHKRNYTSAGRTHVY